VRSFWPCVLQHVEVHVAGSQISRNQQQLLANFEDYLNAFSPNVQDIIDNFKLRNQLPTLSKADALGTLINKFLDPQIDLSPKAIDNHAMGTIFEELVRRFKTSKQIHRFCVRRLA
jgi:type I restriction-modification system DNA methylase subunit